MTHYRYCIALVILSLFWLQPVTAAMAGEKQSIITVGPSWEGFTNEDGRGLYHDIIRQVFAGYEVRHLYVPTVQANSMVAIGRADIKMCDTKSIESLVLAAIPMYENDFYALFLHEKIGKWQGERSLKGKKFVWREGYYSRLDFPVPIDAIEVRSGESALQMVVLGRADFYVDDLRLIRQSFANTGERLDPKKYGTEKVGTRKYFPVFADSPRGKYLRKHYEQEIERLYRDGTLQKIYDQWGFPMPTFSFDASLK